jgi:[NiFe] hydrogenase diaphorase moiety small subunit
MVIENDTPELKSDRRTIVEMLFVEGNHFCPSCEKSGDCELQALGYRLDMIAPTLPYLWEQRKLDATHPDIFIDRNRCVLCSRCVRASRTEDGKTIFGFEGRGIHMLLNINTQGRLDETGLAVADMAAHVCTVEGSRTYDQKPSGSDIEAKRSSPKV